MSKHKRQVLLRVARQVWWRGEDGKRVRVARPTAEWQVEVRRSARAAWRRLSGYWLLPGSAAARQTARNILANATAVATYLQASRGGWVLLRVQGSDCDGEEVDRANLCHVCGPYALRKVLWRLNESLDGPCAVWVERPSPVDLILAPVHHAR